MFFHDLGSVGLPDRVSFDDPIRQHGIEHTGQQHVGFADDLRRFAGGAHAVIEALDCCRVDAADRLLPQHRQDMVLRYGNIIFQGVLPDLGRFCLGQPAGQIDAKRFVRCRDVFADDLLAMKFFQVFHRSVVGLEIELPQFALQRDLYDPSTIRALVDAAFIVRPAAHGNRLLPSLYFTPRPVDQLLVI